jgi:hypothetical protein
MVSPSHPGSDQLRQAGLTQETEGFARQFLHHQFALAKVADGNLQGVLLVRQLQLMRDHFGLEVDWLRTLANDLGVQQLVKHQNRCAPFTALACSSSPDRPLLNSTTAVYSATPSAELSGAGCDFDHVNGANFHNMYMAYLTSSSSQQLQSMHHVIPSNVFAFNVTRVPTDFAVPPGFGASNHKIDHHNRSRLIISDTLDTFVTQASVPSHSHTELDSHRLAVLDARALMHQNVTPTMIAVMQRLHHDIFERTQVKDGTMVDSIEDYSDLLDSADLMDISTKHVVSASPTQTAEETTFHTLAAGPNLLQQRNTAHQFQSLGDRLTTDLEAQRDTDQYSRALQEVLQSSTILQPQQYWYPGQDVLGQPSFSIGTTDDSSQHSWSSTPALTRTENKAARRVANMSPERAVLMRRQSRDRYRRYKQQAQHQEYQEQARLDVLQAQRQKLLEDKASLGSELSALLAQIRDG